MTPSRRPVAMKGHCRFNMLHGILRVAGNFICHLMLNQRTTQGDTMILQLFPYKRGRFSMTMHDTVIFWTPIYISLYFPFSFNRDRTIMFLRYPIHTLNNIDHTIRIYVFFSPLDMLQYPYGPTLHNPTTIARKREV